MNPPTSLSTAMPLRSFLNLLLSLLCNFLYKFFNSIIQSRRGIDVESTELAPDAVEALLFPNEDESEAAVDERCASDDSSVEFELPPISRVSDVGMETDYYVSSPLFPEVADHASTPLQATAIGTENELKFEQVKQLQLSPLKRSDVSDSVSDSEFGLAAIQHQQKKISIEQKIPKTLALPAILEDCESPKVVYDMKPLKLNNKKIDRKDLLQQIQTFHKIYTDKMHKLDVLNHQTLNALSFIGLNNEAQDDLMDKKRKKMSSLTVGAAMRSAFGVKFLCAKVSCDEVEAQKASSGALMSKLELIYTGQLCLSWEMLNWQYSMAIKLQKLDLQASFLYNQVADEFLQFQLAVRRFVEDDTNQGRSWKQNYIEKRAASSAFLQVPIIRDDRLKVKKLNQGECFVTISSLVKTIDECRRIFCELLQEKKYGGTGTRVVPQDESSHALLIQAQAKLHKKKKNVRELTKSKGGIVKMICHTKEQPWLDQDAVDARVALKLVSRVLGMSEISRDQTLWCHTKLDGIKLIDRRLCIEPTFLLFPC